MNEFFIEHSDVIIAGFGLVGILLTAMVGVGKVYISRLQLHLAQRELKFQSQALSFSDFLEDWGSTSAAMKQLMDDTTIDRIMILRAWNGTLEPKWTTAVYQMRELGQEPVQYIHTELDYDYVEKLRAIVRTGMVAFSVNDSPQSLIRDIYMSEGVTASCWVHIDSKSISGTNATSITYASFATHEVDEFDQETLTKCRILAGRLKGLANNFSGSND